MSEPTTAVELPDFEPTLTEIRERVESDYRTIPQPDHGVMLQDLRALLSWLNSMTLFAKHTRATPTVAPLDARHVYIMAGGNPALLSDAPEPPDPAVESVARAIKLDLCHCLEAHKAPDGFEVEAVTCVTHQAITAALRARDEHWAQVAEQQAKEWAALSRNYKPSDPMKNSCVSRAEMADDFVRMIRTSKEQVDGE